MTFALPASARIFAHDAVEDLVRELRARLRAALFGRDVERAHTLGRTREALARLLEQVVAADDVQARLDDIARLVARDEALPGALVVQRAPYVRVQPPRAPGMPFHVDRYTRVEATTQRALWIPLVDVIGPEGLWLVDDDDAREAFARGPLGDQQAWLRERARAVPMRIGEVLVFGALTAHGSQPHTLDVTRASIDTRIAAEHDAPRGRLGWRSRPLALS